MISEVLPLLYTILTIIDVDGFSRDDPIVATKVGMIRGLRSQNGSYTMFLGIPYAKVNETFPFGDTLPVPPFEGVFEAYDDSVRCPQRFEGKITGTVDCLHVNIHVPDSAGPENLLPVMIYIFGGRFVIGGPGRSLLDPEYLVRKDVIFVSIGFRLGPYGFMCLDIPEVPGNHGLKDQEKVLSWIKDNIESFGGDVNRMTLFGHSAGAISVGLHLFSDSNKVYRNVILQSGSSLVPRLLRPSDPSLPLRLAAKLGIKTNDIYEALHFLAKVPPHDVIAVDDPDPVYRPCVEKTFPGVASFLNDYPINLRPNNSQGLTIMQGHTPDELLSSISKDTFVRELFKKELIANDYFNFKGPILDEAKTVLKRFYIGDEEISEQVLWKIVNFLSDFYYIYPAMKLIPRYFEAGIEKNYQYVFSYDGKRNFGKILSGIEDHPGVVHVDCLGYVFLLRYPGIQEPAGQDAVVLDMVTTLWTNFAKYNDPTPRITKLIPVKWKPITRGSPEYYMEINGTLTLGKAYQHQRINFWRLFYKTYQEYELGYNYTGKYNEKKQLEGLEILISLSTVMFMLGTIGFMYVALRDIYQIKLKRS